MKSKPQIQEEKIDNQREPDFEIKSEGPSIASAQRNKFLVISASILLVSFVIYFFFLGEENPAEKKLQNLEAVETPTKATFARGDDASPFEFKDPKNTAPSEIAEILDKPSTPDIPTIPELPEDTSVIESLILAPQSKNKEKDLSKVDQVEQFQNTKDSNIAINQENNQKNTDINSANKQKNENIAVNNSIPTKQPETTVESSTNPNPPAAEAKSKEEEPINPRYSPIIVFAGGSGTNMRGVGYENNIINLKSDGVDQLKALEDKTEINVIGDRVHTIAQGKFLSAVIETAITTEMPGQVRGIIDRDVYGESGKEILLPRGTRIFGEYTASVRRGQGRVEINWSRLLRQDGVSIGISFAASDQFGRAGVQGEVDNKISSVIANSLLTSVLAVGSLAATQGILGDNTATTTVNPTLGTATTTGNAANQALYDVTKNVIGIVGQILKNSIDLNPIIRIPQGVRITVIVNSDLRIPSMKKNKSFAR